MQIRFVLRVNMLRVCPFYNVLFLQSIRLDKALAHQLRKSFTVYGLRLSEDALRYGSSMIVQGH